jgi:hypothetical protein
MALKLGRGVIIKLDANNVGGAGASWVTIGQQAEGSLEKSVETAEGRTKQDAGWPNDLIIGHAWSVPCEGKLDPSSAQWIQLNAAQDAEVKQWIQIDKSAVGGTKREGQVIVSKITEKYSDKDAVTFSVDFTGQGQMVTSP